MAPGNYLPLVSGSSHSDTTIVVGALISITGGGGDCPSSSYSNKLDFWGRGRAAVNIVDRLEFGWREKNMKMLQFSDGKLLTLV